MITTLPDSTLIIEDSPTRDWARETVAEYRGRQRVEQATVREGAGRSWLPEDYLWLLNASVIRPAAGEIQRRLYR